MTAYHQLVIVLIGLSNKHLRYYALFAREDISQELIIEELLLIRKRQLHFYPFSIC